MSNMIYIKTDVDNHNKILNFCNENNIEILSSTSEPIDFIVDCVIDNTLKESNLKDLFIEFRDEDKQYVYNRVENSLSELLDSNYNTIKSNIINTINEVTKNE